MIATLSDDRRRVVMPPELPAKSPVTIQQLDEDTFLVKRQRPSKKYVMIAVPVIKELKSDPVWEAVETRMAAHHKRTIAPFEE
ncbi:MAG: hypothetical protein ABMA26_14850 [Limisphaerales bacterium]